MLRPKNICQTTDLLILGGGLTGLCAAYYLRRHLSCILLEKSNRTGGVIQSQRINKFLVELGPDCFMNQKPWAYELAKELGLENEIIKAEPSHQQVWVLKNGSFEISDYQDPSVTEFLGSRALATPSTPYSFQNGMQTLTDKLSDRVDNFVLKNTYATHVNWDKLLVTCNSGIQIQAKSILIALPAWEAAKLLGFEIPFKTTQSHCVYLAYDHAAFSKPFDAYGLIIPATEPQGIRAITFVSSKFPNRAPPGFVLLRTFLKAGFSATAEIQKLFGPHSPPTLEQHFHINYADPKYHPDHFDQLNRIQNQLAPGVWIIGSPYAGVGISDCIYQAKKATQKIMDFL